MNVEHLLVFGRSENTSLVTRPHGDSEVPEEYGSIFDWTVIYQYWYPSYKGSRCRPPPCVVPASLHGKQSHTMYDAL